MTARCDAVIKREAWTKPRRVGTEVEWHTGETKPLVGFIATNMAPAQNVVAYYIKRERMLHDDSGDLLGESSGKVDHGRETAIAVAWRGETTATLGGRAP